MYNDVSLLCTNCAISNAVLKLGHFLCAKNRVKINESCLKDLSICMNLPLVSNSSFDRLQINFKMKNFILVVSLFATVSMCSAPQDLTTIKSLLMTIFNTYK